MSTGISNSKKAETRKAYAAGEITTYRSTEC